MAIAVTMTGLGSEDGTVNQYVLANVGAATVAGRCLVAFVAISDTTKSVTSFTDDTTGGPMIYILVGTAVVSGLRFECWATAYNGTKANASYIKANLSGMTPAAITVIELSGVLALGINGTANNTTANPTKSLTTQDANNYVATGFGTVGATLVTGLTGTLERTINSAGAAPVVCSLVDNTSVGAGNVTTAVTRTATTWAAIALELRTVAAGLFVTTVPTVIVEVELAGAGAGWTSLATDLVAEDGLHVVIGMTGGGPLDRVAASGMASFSLRNDAKNSANLIGYYSLFHANKRAGWALGIGCRIRLYNPNDGATWTRMVGRLDAIDPIPGLKRERRVRVTAVDWMDEAARWVLTPDIGEQVGKRWDEILAAILLRMPRQPSATNFDIGGEAYSYALDTSTNSQQPALAEFTKLAFSELGLIYLRGDGTLRAEGRHTRLLNTTTNWTIPDTDLQGLDMPSTRDDVINTIRVTQHPKTVDDAPTTIVYDQANVIELAPSATKTLLGSYRNPVTGDPIGATAVQPLIPLIDYIANASADGSGADITSDVSIVLTAGAAGAKFAVTNANAGVGYLTLLQLRGRGIYDRGAIQLQATDATSIAANGEHVVTFDQPYQDLSDVGQGAADYLLAKYGSASALVRTVTVFAKTPTLLGQVLARDISDRLAISETVTGANAAFFINGIDLKVQLGRLVEATYILAPAADPFSGLYWILGTSTLGTDTLPAPF